MTELQETATGADEARNRGSGLAAIGALIGAVAASSCCLLPLALFGVGVTGAWVGNLTALAPYQPIFITLTAACLGVGYWMVYRKPKGTCETDGACGPAGPRRVVRIALCCATLLVVSAAAFPYVGPYLLDV